MSFHVVISDVLHYLFLSAPTVSEGGSSRDDAGLVAARARHAAAAEEAVVLHALLPEVLALVAPVEEEFYHVAVVTISLRVQFNQKLLPLEGDLAYLGPAEGVDLGGVLEHHDAHVRHRQVQRHVLVVLGRVHFYTV